MKKIIAMALMLSLCLFFSCVRADEKDSGKDVKTKKTEDTPTPKTLNPPVDDNEQKAEEAPERLPFETDMGALSRKMGGKKLGVVQGDLGSKTNPVRCAGPSGEHAYLDRLRWKDGQPAKYERLGSVGIGIYGHILDLYKVTCADGSVHEIYMDMYYTKLVDHHPVPGFKLAKEGQPAPEEEKNKNDDDAQAPEPEIWIGLCQPNKDNKIYGLSLSKSNGKLLGLFLEVEITNEEEPQTMNAYRMNIVEEGKKLKCEVFVEKDEKSETFELIITLKGKMEGDSFTVELEVPSKGIKEKIEMATPSIGEEEEGEEGEGEEENPGQAPFLPDDDPKNKEREQSAPGDEDPET